MKDRPGRRNGNARSAKSIEREAVFLPGQRFPAKEFYYIRECAFSIFLFVNDTLGALSISYLSERDDGRPLLSFIKDEMYMFNVSLGARCIRHSRVMLNNENKKSDIDVGKSAHHQVDDTDAVVTRP